jgi:hypothetical protein
MSVWRQRGRLAGALLVIVAVLCLPATAAAHGPADPAASSYLAQVTQVPTGATVKVVDGDQRLWMRVDPRRTVVVLDYQGAPYLRFSRVGVEVNAASAMYYLNQVPAQIPPLHTGPGVAPEWSHVSAGHSYGWHDGRLHALATAALAPGSTYLGRWNVRLRVDRIAAAIAGGLYFAASPSIVWFWPILVALACVLAARRLRRPELDGRVARALAATALAVALAFAAWGAWRLVRRRHGWFTFFIIAPLALGGCGASATAPPPEHAIPAALIAQARPIGRGAAFHPPARGWAGTGSGACRVPLGRRDGVHVELFAANRVVLVAAGIGVRGPVTRSGGRITGARCYGELVTLEPTGVVLARPGARLTLADLFRAWGRPLSSRRLLSFPGRVAVFVDGRRRAGPPGGVPLTRHAEIVLEVGPHVPPHPAYHFPPGV